MEFEGLYETIQACCSPDSTVHRAFVHAVSAQRTPCVPRALATLMPAVNDYRSSFRNRLHMTDRIYEATRDMEPAAVQHLFALACRYGTIRKDKVKRCDALAARSLPLEQWIEWAKAQYSKRQKYRGKPWKYHAAACQLYLAMRAYADDMHQCYDICNQSYNTAFSRMHVLDVHEDGNIADDTVFLVADSEHQTDCRVKSVWEHFLEQPHYPPLVLWPRVRHYADAFLVRCLFDHTSMRESLQKHDEVWGRYLIRMRRRL